MTMKIITKIKDHLYFIIAFAVTIAMGGVFSYVGSREGGLWVFGYNMGILFMIISLVFLLSGLRKDDKRRIKKLKSPAGVSFVEDMKFFDEDEHKFL